MQGVTVEKAIQKISIQSDGSAEKARRARRRAQKLARRNRGSR